MSRVAAIASSALHPFPACESVRRLLCSMCHGGDDMFMTNQRRSRAPADADHYLILLVQIHPSDLGQHDNTVSSARRPQHTSLYTSYCMRSFTWCPGTSQLQIMGNQNK